MPVYCKMRLAVVTMPFIFSMRWFVGGNLISQSSVVDGCYAPSDLEDCSDDGECLVDVNGKLLRERLGGVQFFFKCDGVRMRRC
jgi:hypothetical protein